ncbi:hypothetical protein AO385_0059 [Moraxella catarrhalis]|nr:hypothetical protein AO385_0059 [Moraxella catarrhalis]
MIVADVLKRIGDTLNKIILLNDGHGDFLLANLVLSTQTANICLSHLKLL